MECQNYKDCNLRLEKIMRKLKKEICKADTLLQNCGTNNNTIIYHEPNKDEKKKIIDTIKTNSTVCSLFIEELKMHRKEVKHLLNLSNNLIEKYEQLKIQRKKQIEQVENISIFLSNKLQSISNSKQTAADTEWYKKQNEENNKLEEAFHNIMSQYSILLKNHEAENKYLNEHLNCAIEENKEDKILFSLVVKSIRKAFEIMAKIECQEINFVEYVFSEPQDSDSEDSNYCCDTK